MKSSQRKLGWEEKSSLCSPSLVLSFAAFFSPFLSFWTFLQRCIRYCVKEAIIGTGGDVAHRKALGRRRTEGTAMLPCSVVSPFQRAVRPLIWGSSVIIPGPVPARGKSAASLELCPLKSSCCYPKGFRGTTQCSGSAFF